MSTPTPPPPAAPTPKTETSPKVWATLLSLVLTGLTVALLENVTPELFAGLGAYKALAYAVTLAVIGAAAAWLKTDPLRNIGAVLRDAHGVGGTVEPTVPVENPDGTFTPRPAESPQAPRPPDEDGPAHRAEPTGV